MELVGGRGEQVFEVESAFGVLSGMAGVCGVGGWRKDAFGWFGAGVKHG